MKLLGEIASNTLQELKKNHSSGFIISLEEWGEAIIKGLKKQGYYINKVKGDPSGRW
jgi:hypothetical protein